MWLNEKYVSNIKVTVALPTWENKDIIWLQLESLCRQETQYIWELVVCEDVTPNMAGKEMILSYSDRLKEAGCARISYIPIPIKKEICSETEKVIEFRTPLSKKWWIIAHASLGSSFLLTASDDYSPPNRIEITHTILESGYNWFEIGEALFFNLNTFVTASYTNEIPKTGVLIATKTNLVKNMSSPWPKKFVDNWLFTKIGKIKRYRFNGLLKCLFTDGANKISKTRRNLYKEKGNYKRYFKNPTQKVEDILESHIIDKLKKQFFINTPIKKIKSKEDLNVLESIKPKITKVLPQKQSESVKKIKKNEVTNIKDLTITNSKQEPKQEVKSVKKPKVKPVKKQEVKPVKKQEIKSVKRQTTKKFINIRSNRGKK